MKTREITRVRVSGGPHPGGYEARLTMLDRNTARLECASCGASTTFTLPGGHLDLDGFAAMNTSVRRIHQGDA